jgi:hypothetical protein
MFLLARYTVAAAVFLSASAASAVEARIVCCLLVRLSSPTGRLVRSMGCSRRGRAAEQRVRRINVVRATPRSWRLRS